MTTEPDTEEIRNRIRSLTLPDHTAHYLDERLPAILDGTGKISSLSLALISEYTGASVDWLLHGRVHITRGGEAFHANRTCRTLRHGFRTVHQADALASRRTPCTHCMPGVAKTLFQGACAEDFGHTPHILEIGDAICDRCHETYHSIITDAHGRKRRRTHFKRVLWPCTSAIVFGFAPRPGEVAA